MPKLRAPQQRHPSEAGAPVSRADKPVFRHPVLDEARRLAAAGQSKEAANQLEALSSKVKPFEAAQLLTAAATILRTIDRKRAIELAERARDLQPELPQAWITLSVLREEARNRKGAIEDAKRALELKCSPKDLIDLGTHLSRIGQDRLAMDAARRGFAESGEALQYASYVLRVAVQSADWELADRITKRFQEKYTEGNINETFETPRTHLLWCADDATNIAVISAFAERSFAAREPMVTQAWPGAEQKRKIRIGYLSYDYRDHATSLLMLGAMRYHDRERFEVYGYCTSWDDNSALRREMLSRFTVARSFSQASDRRAAEQIRSDRIDVLIDLNGLTEGTRHGILAWHPAPVQISYLGFPGTSGGRYIDYIIGDDHTVPAGVETRYPEKVIRIPPTYQVNDYAARWLPPAPRAASLGLPEGKVVLGMFNNMNKVGSTVWAVWMRILHRLPNAVLWMLDPGEVARENLLKAAKQHGISGDQILFAPKARQEAHIARLRACDLVLDPWPYGGHTTTGDALFAGIPVVALEGTNFASRVSGGLLRAAGLGALVAPDIEAYVQLAVDLANNAEKSIQIRRYLRQRRDRLPVFDAATRTRQLEAAFVAVHERCVQGLSPTHIRVGVKSPQARAKAADPGRSVQSGAEREEAEASL